MSASNPSWCSINNDIVEVYPSGKLAGLELSNVATPKERLADF